MSHLPQSAVEGWFSVGYNMLYRLLREATVDWRRVLLCVSRRVASYIGSHCECDGGSVRCLVADDTDIAKSGMKMEKIGRVYSHTQHRHILDSKAFFSASRTAPHSDRWTSPCTARKGKVGFRALRRSSGKPAREQTPAWVRPPASGTPNTSRAR